jgi:hypothetical protein
MPFINPPLAAVITFVSILHGLASDPDSWHRYVSVAVLCIFVVNIYFIHPPTYTENRLWDASVALFIWMQCLKALDDLVITCASYPDPDATTPAKKSKKNSKR